MQFVILRKLVRPFFFYSFERSMSIISTYNASGKCKHFDRSMEICEDIGLYDSDRKISRRHDVRSKM